MKRHYVVVKTVICDLIGEACPNAENVLYKKPIILDCENCPAYIEWKSKKFDVK